MRPSDGRRRSSRYSMTPSRGSRRGFTLLEVMVSVAILALAVVPMLLTRERCYDMAWHTKNERTIQELAQKQLAWLSLNVIRGEGVGEVEGAPDYMYEYTVTIYDFRSGLEEDENDRDDRETGRLDTSNAPRDAVFDEETDDVGPHMARHVVLKIYAVDSEETKGKEFMIDTYIPLLMTKEQYEDSKKKPEEIDE